MSTPELAAAQLPATPELPPDPEEVDRFTALAKLSPRAAILEARASLEVALRGLARRADIRKPEIAPLTVLVRDLRQNGFIDDKTSGLIDDLRSIGNSAAHGGEDLTEEQALSYGKISTKV